MTALVSLPDRYSFYDQRLTHVQIWVSKAIAVPDIDPSKALLSLSRHREAELCDHANWLPDWEYPGAEDRGGSKTDANNYVALLKEMREAINRSGRSYIVTFTAPTSYWYLRNFDIKGMEPYVDWINVMSYDLHGVWDKSNPIGNHVLAHTNLTEISLAFDLVGCSQARKPVYITGINVD